MRHSLLEKDPVNRTGRCSVCGPVKIRKAGNGFSCAEKAKTHVRAYKRRNPDRDRGGRSAHSLTAKDERLQRGTCAVCGPVDIVATGRGWACRKRENELGRFNHQRTPQRYCDACQILDGDIVWLTATGCPRCNESLNEMFSKDAATERLLGSWAKEMREEGLHVEGLIDPYAMPENESAVPRWKTLGHPTEPALT